MSFLWLTIQSALRVLRRNPLRAGLTMLGIVIGVGAVVGMVSLGQGATASVQREIARTILLMSTGSSEPFRFLTCIVVWVELSV